MEDNILTKRIGTTALAYRGYNVTNLGKTPELLEHEVYGSVIEKHLQRGSEICAECLGQPVDLVTRVRNREETTLESYAEALAMIVSVELAQRELLAEHFGLDFNRARMVIGYSLGEITAVIAAGMMSMEAAMTPLLTLSGDAVDLAHDVEMGVVFSRGPALDMAGVNRLCLEITAEGQGMIAISTYLSPNTVLILGQQNTVDRFKDAMKSEFTERIHLRKNDHRWPPIHTPITWYRNISNRAGVMLSTAEGGFAVPDPPIYSCVTGEKSYNRYNTREILTNWVDHPQRLWAVIDKSLSAGVESFLHFGPDPNIIPATFARLSNNVTTQLNKRSLSSLGLRAVSQIVRRRSWIGNLLSSDASLLRAPFVEHIIVEDWLLENSPN